MFGWNFNLFWGKGIDCEFLDKGALRVLFFVSMGKGGENNQWFITSVLSCFRLVQQWKEQGFRVMNDNWLSYIKRHKELATRSWHVTWKWKAMRKVSGKLSNLQAWAEVCLNIVGIGGKLHSEAKHSGVTTLSTLNENRSHIIQQYINSGVETPHKKL